MRDNILDTDDKKILAGREAGDFQGSLCGRVIIENLAAMKRGALSSIVGIAAYDSFAGPKAIEAAAICRTCDSVMRWLRELEQEGRAISGE